MSFKQTLGQYCNVLLLFFFVCFCFFFLVGRETEGLAKVNNNFATGWYFVKSPKDLRLVLPVLSWFYLSSGYLKVYIINYYKYCTESLVSGYSFSFVSAERRKISRTIKKAEKNTFPLNPFNTKKRRTSTAADIPPDEDFDSN